MSAISTPVDLFYTRRRILIRGLPGRADLHNRTCWPLAAPSSADVSAFRTRLQRDELPALTVLKARPRGRRGAHRQPARFDIALGSDASLVLLDIDGHWVSDGPEALIPDAAGQLFARLDQFTVEAPHTCRPSLCYAGGQHPRYLQLEITTHCNLRCGYCTNRLLSDKQHTPLDRLLRMLDGIDFRHVTDVELTGLGESLLHPELLALVTELRRRGRLENIGLITNGTVATLERCRPLLEAGLTRIVVSVDSLDPRRFARSRAGGSLDVVRANVLSLASFRRSAGPRFALNLRAVLLDDPYRDAEGILKFSAEHGLDRPHFNGLDQRPVAIHDYAVDLRDAKSPAASEATIAAWADQRWNELTGASWPPESPAVTRHELPWLHPHLHDDFDVCRWVLHSAYVGGDGFCIPCCEQLTDLPRQRIASVLERPIAQLWNDELLYAYRLPLALGLIPPSCEGCDYAPRDGERLVEWQARDEARQLLEDEDGFDREFGTATTDEEIPVPFGISEEAVKGASIYWPTLPRTFRKIMAAIDIAHDEFVFVDFGCGKGRTLLLASDFPFKRIIGVELMPHLCQIAAQNINIYRSPTQRCTAIQALCVDAAAYTLPDENTVFYFFDPLRADVLAKVQANIEASLKACPRRIFVVFLHALHRDEGLFTFLKPVRSVDGGSPGYHPEFPWTIFTNEGATQT